MFPCTLKNCDDNYFQLKSWYYIWYNMGINLHDYLWIFVSDTNDEKKIYSLSVLKY